MKEPLKAFGEGSLYGMGRLRRKLEGEQSVGGESVRSIGSIRSFKAETRRAKGNVSNRSQSTGLGDSHGDWEGRKSGRIKKTPKVFFHRFVNKIVSYAEKGIHIVENNVRSICRKEEVVENREVKRTLVGP
jgi:hypothetical protein